MANILTQPPSLRTTVRSPCTTLPSKQLVARPFLAGRAIHKQQPRSAALQIRAKNKNVEKIADAVVDIVPRPSFIPRGVARALIGLLGAGFVWSLVQKLFTTAVFFGSIFAGLSFYLKTRGTSK